MNIRQAILKAADHIERHPAEFDFESCQVPDSPGCGTPGCAVGWIIHFAGMTDNAFYQFARQYMGIETEGVFYRRMDDINPQWSENAALCASMMRDYADTYHPAPVVRTGLPDVVRAIFTRPASAPPPATAEEWMAMHDRTIEALK